MIDFDSAELVETFGGEYHVTRRAAAIYVNGIATNGTASTLCITAAIWPASGRDLQRLPEGRRSQETRTGVSTTRLLTGGQGAANEADLVTIDGDPWEVQQVQAWPASPGFWGFIVQRPNL